MEFINYMNVTCDDGIPTQSYHLLQGKYRRFIAADHRDNVERWYNNFSTAEQRRNFKNIVRQVLMPANRSALEAVATDEKQMHRGEAIMKCHGGQHICREYRKLTALWLSACPEPERQKFRVTFGKIEPIALFNGRSDYQLTYTNEAVAKTAEYVYRRTVDDSKRKNHARQLAKLRGTAVPASVASTGLPAVDSDSNVGSLAMATTVFTRVGSEVRSERSSSVKHTTRPIPIIKKGPNATTYDAFFGDPPPTKQLQPSGQKAWMTSRPGAPWGNVQDGFVPGTLVSHTTLFYPPNTKYLNYNENYANLLAMRHENKQHNVPGTMPTTANRMKQQMSSASSGLDSATRRANRPRKADTARTAASDASTKENHQRRLSLASSRTSRPRSALPVATPSRVAVKQVKPPITSKVTSRPVSATRNEAA
ncbi:hypothetical protein DIPPA_05608 [Diplonema papillatum]|nr:hypothetical protein DIPPA_05608 [Diplonema papillatum]